MPLPEHLSRVDLDPAVNAFVQAARTKDPADLCSHHILDRVPWIFQEDRAQYIDWKRDLATALAVDPYGICIVGSAATGVSMNPGKEFRIFSAASDIDVAVISAHHFDVAWRVIREFASNLQGSLSNEKKNAVKQHRQGLLFDGCIGTEKVLSLLPFGASWASALAEAAGSGVIQGRDVNARIYRDFEALRAYQMRSARRIWEEFTS